MKYAVIYQSKSGNTKQVANEIYASIDSVEKEIVDTDQMMKIFRMHQILLLKYNKK